MEDFTNLLYEKIGYGYGYSSPFIDLLKNLSSAIDSVVEGMRLEKTIPVQVPHGNPYISGRNEAVDEQDKLIKKVLNN